MDKHIEEMAKHCCFPCEMEDDGRCLEGINPCACSIALTTAEALYKAGYRRQDEIAFEVIDKFRNELIKIFIDMCGGNDYNQINLLQIGDAIDAFYDSYIAELKKIYGVTEE